MLKPFLLALVLAAGCAAIGELPAPCDSLTLVQLGESCKAKVRAECKRDANDVVDESCPTLIACSKRLKNWHECTDGGTGEGGAK